MHDKFIEISTLFHWIKIIERSESLLSSKIEFTAAFHFWSYYNMEKGKDRDQKLAELEPWLFLSNFAYATLLLLITGFLAAIRDEPGLVVLCFIIVGAFIIQYHYQRGICGFAILRSKDQMLKKSDLIDLASEFLDGLEDIFGAFFKDNEEYVSSSQHEKQQKNEEQSTDDKSTDEKNTDEKSKFYRNNQQNNENDSTFSNSGFTSMSMVEEILKKYNIPIDADKKIINKHYRSLAKEYHPDSPTGDSAKFIELGKDIEFLIESLKIKQSA